MPKVQYSHWYQVTPGLRRSRRGRGHIQARLLAGFSIVQGIRRQMETWQRVIVKSRSRLPRATAFLSHSRGMSGSPRGNSSDLILGGPPGRSRTRENELQGNPPCHPRMRPARAQPMINILLLLVCRSYWPPSVQSHKRVTQPLRPTAVASRPVPENSSKKAAVTRGRGTLRAGRGASRRGPGRSSAHASARAAAAG